MADLFASHGTALNSPGRRHYRITPSDSVNEAISFRGLYCNTAGVVVIVDEAGTALEYTVAAGQIIDMGGKRVNSTGTTATAINGMY